MGLGEFADARAVLQEATAAAERTRDQRLKASSTVIGLFVGLFSRDAGISSDQMLRTTQELIPVLQREQAHYELATAWRLVLTLYGDRAATGWRQMQQKDRSRLHGWLTTIDSSRASAATSP